MLTELNMVLKWPLVRFRYFLINCSQSGKKGPIFNLLLSLRGADIQNSLLYKVKNENICFAILSVHGEAQLHVAVARALVLYQ